MKNIMLKYYKISGLIVLGLFLMTCKPDDKEQEWVSLFNGKDLRGWDTWLSYQPGSGNSEILGLNNDPAGIFSVVGGAIRVDGRIWGALTSTQEFENYHLRLKFKWGEKRYPPRENEMRDSGLLYHCVGPHGAQDDHWMRSHECQIMEGNCGDYHSLDGASIDIEADTVEVEGNKNLKYAKGGDLLHSVRRRVIKSETSERPYGEWNEIELIAAGDKIRHVVNGKVVLEASNSSQTVDGQQAALTKGKIQLQSEGAEIFYKDIEIKFL
jgi:hypothetical protein